MIAPPILLRCQPVNSCFLLAGSLLLCASSAPSVRAQHVPPLELKYFEKVKTIRFDDPDTLLIGTINHMDVDPAGRILLVDQTGRQVLLFDSTGTLLASLDPRICHPGFTFRPVSTRFGGDAHIFLVNAGPWGYRFTADGACLGSVDDEFRSTKFFDVDPMGVLYGVYTRPDLTLRHMSAAGETIGVFSLPPPRYPNATSRFGGGGLIADGAHIYFATAPETEILKIGLDGTLVGRILKRSSWFRSPRRDVPPDLTPQFWNAVRNWTATSTWSIFELSDETLMIQFENRERGTGYQIFTKDGALVAEELGLKTVFLHGGYGLVYRPVRPALDGQGELPNPYVEVYRFVAR